MTEPVSDRAVPNPSENPRPSQRVKESSDSSVDLAARVHALIAQWRAETGTSCQCGECRLIRSRADALEAALAAAPQAEEAPETWKPGYRWTATRDMKWGCKIWYDGRPMFQVIAGVEDSRITPDDPVPQWQKCVDLVLTLNRAALAAAPQETEVGIPLVQEVLHHADCDATPRGFVPPDDLGKLAEEVVRQIARWVNQQPYADLESNRVEQTVYRALQIARGETFTNSPMQAALAAAPQETVNE